MITCEEIYDLHTTGALESALYEAYREIPLDSRNSMRKNDTPLHMACAFADENAVRILLERGADVNVRNDDGDTPLCVLARCKCCGKETTIAGIAGLLVSKEARVPRSGKNTTALIEAVGNRHFLMADILLMSGCRIDSTNSNGDNVLHVICQSAGDIAYDIKRTKERIADFSERWYSEKDKREAYENMEYLEEVNRQCFLTAKRILEKLPDFPKRTISYLKKVPGKIEQIPLVNKCYSTVSSLCSRLSSYIDDLFGRVSTKVAEEWSLPAKLRGTIIEEKLAKIQYAAYEHVGKLADGFFPVFDFFKNGEGISVKTIDVTLPSYEKDSAILRKVKQYASDLNDDVILRKVNNFKKGKELGDKLNEVRKVSTKRLDIYIPKGSLSRTKDIPGQIGDVLIRIFEY